MNVGLRYRNNMYILSTLDERGEYAPTYLDGQCYLTWDPDGYGPWELQALGVYGRNDYSFLPATRETNIGTVNQAARLTVYYDSHPGGECIVLDYGTKKHKRVNRSTFAAELNT